MEGLWGFLLTELPDGRTRLVISGYENEEVDTMPNDQAPWEPPGHCVRHGDIFRRVSVALALGPCGSGSASAS